MPPYLPLHTPSLDWGQPNLRPLRRHRTGAAASPPRPPGRQGPPKAGLVPTTRAPLWSPGTNILAIQRHFFTVAQDFLRDLMKHIMLATCKEESCAY